jgi:hypothetical protein
MVTTAGAYLEPVAHRDLSRHVSRQGHVVRDAERRSPAYGHFDSSSPSS